MYLLYEVVLYLALLLALPYFLLMGFLRGKYIVNFPTRMGFYDDAPERHDLWIHAVSVGETLAAQPVVAEILRLRPETTMVFTTTTITGQAQARRLFPQATVTYFPLDFRFAVNRFLDTYAPAVFATLETEIWPNVTRLSKRRGVRLILANGRISDRSFPRYRFFRGIVGPVLSNYDRVLAREDTDRQRFIALGAPREAVETTGNVKFDYEVETAALEAAGQLERLIAGRKVVVLGSTKQGEDEELLPYVERLVAEHNAFVIIAPRRPERFELVAGLLATSSLRFVRRSEIEEFAGEADVLLLDSVGELRRIYRYATVAFVGGSLVPEGGQNPIEAAATGVPVCFGPSMTNFREIATTFVKARAGAQCATAADVADFIRHMLDNESLHAEWSGRALETVSQNRGASTRTAERIIELLA